MRHELQWHKHAWQDYQYWLKTDKQVLAKINALIQAIDRAPFTGEGKPEPLKPNLKGCWSRRINCEHRLVYQVEASSIIILACRYHY